MTKCPKCEKDFAGRPNAEQLVQPMQHGWVDPATKKMIYCGTATPEQVAMYKESLEILKKRKIDPTKFTKIDGGKQE